jgi:hypothetical protein
VKSALCWLFYCPGDWIADKTSARDRRAIGAWVLIFSLGPGTTISILYSRAIWWIVILSILAIQLTGFTMVFAETPVEEEDEIKKGGSQIEN